MVIKKRVRAYVYIPVLFASFSYGLLVVLVSPFKDTVNLFISNVVHLKDASQITSIFDESSQKSIELINHKIPRSQIEFPKSGNEYGRLMVDKFNVQTRLSYGDEIDDLKVGVGHFKGSSFPGEPGTTLIGGHNTSDLASLDNVVKGDHITIKTSYGTYQYKVVAKKIANFDDKKAIASLYKKSPQNKLILYTCYPVELVGFTNDRLFVYAELVSGPMIDLNA